MQQYSLEQWLKKIAQSSSWCFCIYLHAQSTCFVFKYTLKKWKLPPYFLWLEMFILKMTILRKQHVIHSPFFNSWLLNTVLIITVEAYQRNHTYSFNTHEFLDNYLHSRFHLLESIRSGSLVVEFVHLSESTFPHSMFCWSCFSPLDFAPIWITTLSGRKNKWFTPHRRSRR